MTMSVEQVTEQLDVEGVVFDNQDLGQTFFTPELVKTQIGDVKPHDK